jgi:hypothetical protein
VNERGFTLTEILVTTVLVMLLGALAAKGYRSQMEAGRADAARSLVLLAAHGNRMAAMDNVSKSTGTASPFLPAPGHDGLLRTPRGRECGPPWDGAALGRCRYTGATDWDIQAYLFRVCRPDGGGGGCCRDCPKGTVACARRKMDGRGCTAEPPDEGRRDKDGAEPSEAGHLMAGGATLRGGTGRPYCEWRYCVDASERIVGLFGAP